MKEKLFLTGLILAVLVVSVGMATAQNNGKDTGRYFVKTNNPIVKSFLNVRHNFPSGFSVELTPRQVGILKSLGIGVEKVQLYHLLPPDKCGDGTCQGFESPDTCPEDCGTGTGISVSWVNPKDGDTVSDMVDIKINATDSDGSIQTVEWNVDDGAWQEATLSSNTGYYEDTWNTSNYAEGSHDLTANATDNESNSKTTTITVTVDNEVDRSATPSDQTPYGIEQIYNDSTISNTSGGSGIDVAILDTGVDTDHPDLKNRLEQCVDFTKGKNYKEGECGDKNGHGTHTSGTALADAGNDGQGIYGVAPEADLYAYRVCNNGCWTDDIAAAIDYAGDHGAEVVSMSLGGDSQSDLIRDAIDRNKDQILFVAAAGNDGPDLETMDYPGADPDVVGVAAINSSYVVPDFSSRGVNDTSFQEKDKYVEVAAAGVDVLSTWNDGTYNTISGTSMSTPHISGFAAKYWSTNTSLTPGEVRNYIQDRADKWDITEGKHAREGYDPAAGIGLPTVE